MRWVGLVKTETGSSSRRKDDATIHGANSSKVYEALRRARQLSCWQTSRMQNAAKDAA